MAPTTESRLRQLQTVLETVRLEAVSLQLPELSADYQLSEHYALLLSGLNRATLGLNHLALVCAEPNGQPRRAKA